MRSDSEYAHTHCLCVYALVQNRCDICAICLRILSYVLARDVHCIRDSCILIVCVCALHHFDDDSGAVAGVVGAFVRSDYLFSSVQI